MWSAAKRICTNLRATEVDAEWGAFSADPPGGSALDRAKVRRGRLQLTCDAEWPLIFAWTGNGYSEVSDQYKDYYRKYLKSLETQIAAYSSESGLAAAQTANPAPTRRGFELSVGPSGEGSAPFAFSPQITAPAPTTEAAPTPRPGDYACTRIEAAKTEAFLGINSDTTMSAAIKDSESADPNKRVLAAAIFSYLGTQEAEQDLKTLSNDADSQVAAIAKDTASMGEDPIQSYRTMNAGRGVVSLVEHRIFSKQRESWRIGTRGFVGRGR